MRPLPGEQRVYYLHGPLSSIQLMAYGVCDIPMQLVKGHVVPAALPQNSQVILLTTTNKYAIPWQYVGSCPVPALKTNATILIHYNGDGTYICTTPGAPQPGTAH